MKFVKGICIISLISSTGVIIANIFYQIINKENILTAVPLKYRILFNILLLIGFYIIIVVGYLLSKKIMYRK